ncbi:MAG TPA: serine hydrolase [Candidatus Saccharimonadales bacterium]|nr:serine hydrolase [Candidatus Saccharimonadales bacterium]
MTKQKLLRYTIALALIIIIVIEVFNLTRPFAQTSASLASLDTPKPAAASLPWPSGQMALGTTEDGLLAIHGQQTPAPIASIAKVITALSVLQKSPLKSGEQGPTITLTDNDVAIYQKYAAEDGSLVPVTAGQQITEYQALQAMMLPSANNIADSLAIWQFGSISTYTTYANSYVKSLGMTGTTVSDASGFSPQTVSTASDLFKLAYAAMGNPVIADLVSQRVADSPAFGTIYNVSDSILGSDGIVGIKTGNTDQAGGCFMFAAKHTIDGQTKTIIGAVVGDPDLSSALSDSQTIIKNVDANFTLVEPVKAGQVVATYKTKWGKTYQAIATKDVKMLVWKDKTPSVKENIKPIKTPATKGQNVGTVQLSSGTTTASSGVILKTDVPKPPITWRLTHF